MTKGSKILFPWIIPFERYLAKEDKVILVRPSEMTGDVPVHCTRGGFVSIEDRQNFDAEDDPRHEIDLMSAISKGLVTFNDKNQEVVWGGAVRYSIKLKKL